MPLNEDQRKWLDTALQNKGRFTRSKTIKKDFENYKRRRDKASDALAGIALDNTIRNTIDKGLTDADELAKNGDFSGAYKSLNGIKLIAKAYGKANGEKIHLSAIDTSLRIISSYLSDIKNLADFGMRHFDEFIDTMNNMPKVEDENTLKQGLVVYKNYLEQEASLRGDLANREKYIDFAIEKITKSNLSKMFSDLEIPMQALKLAGRDTKDQSDRIDLLKTDWESNEGHYKTSSKLYAKKRAGRMAFETSFRNLIKMGKFHGTGAVEDVDVTAADLQDIANVMLNKLDDILVRPQDPREATWKEGDTERLRPASPPKDFEPVDVEKMSKEEILDKLDAEAKKRLQSFKDEMEEDLGIDRKNLSYTDRGDVAPNATPPLFDPSEVLDLWVDGEEFPDAPSQELLDTLSAEIETKMTDFVKEADPDSAELFDLILKSKADLMAMMASELTGVADPDQWAATQKDAFEVLAAKMQSVLCAHCPNKMKSDSSEISVGGVTYVMEQILGEGGFGAARRYKDPATGKTIVVKSLKGEADPHKREEMAGEMRTHQLAQNGDADDEGADNIVKMSGAAVSEDGSLHMVMDDAEGGDLTQTGRNMQLMVSSGMMPEGARDALARDMLIQAAKGLIALEKRGIVHNDIKPENMLLDRDGSVKIIDFGESRFDEDGNTPSRVDGDFGTTGYYEAPETAKSGETVDAKVDGFALGKMVKVLGLDGSVSNVAPQGGVTSMDRLVQGLLETDPKKRPSLEAVLNSSYLQTLETDHTPEDVEDLKQAASDFNAELSSTNQSITLEDLNKKGAQSWDSNWQSLEKQMQKKSPMDVPVGPMQGMVEQFKTTIADLTKKLGSDASKDRETQAKIAEIKEKIGWWEQQVAEGIKARADAGQKEFEDFAKDDAPQVELTDPDDGGKRMISGKAALAERKAAEEQIANLQREFYAALDSEEDDINAKMDTTNAELGKLEAKIEQINKTIESLMGPDAKFYLKKLKLEEVSARFGPKEVPVRERATGR